MHQLIWLCDLINLPRLQKNVAKDNHFIKKQRCSKAALFMHFKTLE